MAECLGVQVWTVKQAENGWPTDRLSTAWANTQTWGGGLMVNLMHLEKGDGVVWFRCDDQLSWHSGCHGTGNWYKEEEELINTFLVSTSCSPWLSFTCKNSHFKRMVRYQVSRSWNTANKWQHHRQDDNMKSQTAKITVKSNKSVIQIGFISH